MEIKTSNLTIQKHFHQLVSEQHHT